MQQKEIKVTMLDNTERVFPSATIAARKLGVNHSRFGTWMYLLDNYRKGRKLPGRGWRRFGIKYIERTGNTSPSKHSKPIVVVYQDNTRAVYADAAAKQELYRRLGVSYNQVNAWANGRVNFPADTGIKRIYFKGERNVSRMRRVLLVKYAENKTPTAMNTVAELAQQLQVSGQLPSHWIAGNQPIPAFYGIEYVCWSDAKNRSRSVWQ